jgi:hypothetical protein
VSSIGVIDGTKGVPQPMASGSFLMKDNVAIEFGMPPASSETEWVDRLTSTYFEVHEYLPDHLRLVCKSSAVFPEDQLNNAEACEFGCMPDFNAWTRKQNPVPNPPLSGFRSCGGHLHIGENGKLTYFLLTNKGKIVTIRTMDAHHGTVSIALDNSEEAIQRRELYGRAGCYRDTDYGVEYRTLSNFWMKEVPFMKLMYRLSNEVVTSLACSFDEVAKWVGKNGKRIQDIINTADIEESMRWIDSELYPRWSDDTKHAFNEAIRL